MESLIVHTNLQAMLFLCRAVHPVGAACPICDFEKRHADAGKRAT